MRAEIGSRFPMRFGIRLLGVLLAGVAVGCSSYPRDFREAAARQPKPATSVVGPWKGEWRSEANGHHGPLWCLIDVDDRGRHAFRYRAGWGAMRFGDYTHEPTTEADGSGRIRFSGEMALPGGAGTYAVEGRVTPEAFRARYRSDTGDRGVMELDRPG